MEAIEKRINQKMYLYFFFSLFLNVVFIFTHFERSGEKVPADYTKELEASKAVLKATKLAYEKRLATYQLRVDSLTRQLKMQQTAIKQSKGRTQEIKTRIGQAQKGISAQELLDRAAKFQISQTLSDAGSELDTKDSLLDSQKQLYENIIAEKDSMIQDCDTGFHVLDQELQKQVRVNESLAKDLKKIERKEKRRRFFNRVLTGGAMVAGTLLLLH